MERAPSKHLVAVLQAGLPLTSAVLLALLSITPSTIQGLGRMGPLLVVIAVYYWAVHRPDVTAYGTVFLMGVCEDLLGGGAFGIATSTDLLVAGLVFSQGRFFVGKTFLIKWATFLPVIALVVVLRLLMTSLLALELVDGHAAFYGFLMTVAFYPLVAWLLAGIDEFFMSEEA